MCTEGCHVFYSKFESSPAADSLLAVIAQNAELLLQAASDQSFTVKLHNVLRKEWSERV